MNFSTTFAGLSLAGFIALMVWPARAEEEIIVGRSAAGQIKVDVGFTPPLELPVSVFPGISGYATGELGVHSILLDDPGHDFFQLSTAADFRFLLLAKDPGMEVWNDTGSGYMGVGETFFIGPAPFDTHPIWNLVTWLPARPYSLTLMVRDLNGVYSDSAPFVLSFTPVPAAGPYSIGISLDDPQQATLLWTTNAVGWELESAAAVETTDWVGITNVPVIAGANFSLSI